MKTIYFTKKDVDEFIETVCEAYFAGDGHDDDLSYFDGVSVVSTIIASFLKGYIPRDDEIGDMFFAMADYGADIINSFAKDTTEDVDDDVDEDADEDVDDERDDEGEVDGEDILNAIAELIEAILSGAYDEKKCDCKCCDDTKDDEDDEDVEEFIRVIRSRLH